jgi:predicted nucleotidyltransferase
MMNTADRPAAQSDIQELTDICRRHGVRDMYAFGSRSQEIAGRLQCKLSVPEQAGSDVDIGILPTRSRIWGPQKKVKLSQELEEFFHCRRVDLVLLPEAEPFLALDIIRGELLFTLDPDRQAEYELFVLRRAGDLLPFQNMRIRMILEEGAR